LPSTVLGDGDREKSIGFGDRKRTQKKEFIRVPCSSVFPGKDCVTDGQTCVTNFQNHLSPQKIIFLSARYSLRFVNDQ